MQHELPQLPWPKDSLAPHLSAETIDFHHGKHHNAYVVKLNELIVGTEFANSTLDEIIAKSSGGIFNNAAQIWNHTFYWNCLTPKSSLTPTGKISELINKKWGSFEKFKTEFTNSAVTNFGSAWTWLVLNNGEIEIFNTSNADTPSRHGRKALLTVDIWEHAYYIDYRNSRPNYLAAFWNLVNWDFVNKQL